MRTVRTLLRPQKPFRNLGSTAPGEAEWRGRITPICNLVYSFGVRRWAMKTHNLLVLCLLLGMPLVAQTTAGGKASSGEWKQLFDGKDLVGWKHVGPGEMTIEDGLMRTQGGMGLLYWTGGTLGDCVIRVVFKMEHQNDNSGVYIRIPIEPREPWMPVHYGYEAQIDSAPDDYHVTGVLYSLTKALARPGKPGPEWNTMEITLDGPHTRIVVNGEKVTEYTEGDPVPPKKADSEPERGPRPNNGYIGLQNHSDKDVVYFKEVAVKMLKK
jgi:3-keto-disaccharide hydrolase